MTVKFPTCCFCETESQCTESEDCKMLRTARQHYMEVPMNNIRSSSCGEYVDYDFYGALAEKLNLPRSVVKKAVLECGFGMAPAAHGMRSGQVAMIVKAFGEEK